MASSGLISYVIGISVMVCTSILDLLYSKFWNKRRTSYGATGLLIGDFLT